MATAAASPAIQRRHEQRLGKDDKQRDTRQSNIVSARAVADCVRSSLGPRGSDKMIKQPGGDVIITNDGATIMKELKLMHPAARMLVDLSKSQDADAGDGTTSVVVVAGALLGACETLMQRGIHPTAISEAFLQAGSECQRILKSMAVPVELSDREQLIKAAVTSLNSKMVSQYSSLLAPMAVDAVLSVIDPKSAKNVNLSDIRVVTKLGGTIDDTELIRGIVFKQRAEGGAGGPTRIEKAKIALIQFQISAPKPYVDTSVVINDYTQMDRYFKEERAYVLNIVNKIKKTGANVVFIQKSILRDAVTDLSLQLFAKLKILVVTDVERTDVDFICKTIGAQPIPSIEFLSPERLGYADLVEDFSSPDGKIVKVTGFAKPPDTVTILVRASNSLMLGEAERSLHDALCVVRSIVKSRHLLPGGGAPEIECAVQLAKHAQTVSGVAGYCMRAYADALEVIPYTLAENAGLPAMAIVTELRRAHAAGDSKAGINIRKGGIGNMIEENVVMPLLVTSSMLSLSTEMVSLMLKIDDVVLTRGYI